MSETDVTEETDLADRLLCGDERVLEDILRRFGGMIISVLTRRYQGVLCEADIEDVLSVGLFRLWQHRNRYCPKRASVKVWLFRITENAARDVLKHGWHKSRMLEVGEYLPESPLPDTAAITMAGRPGETRTQENSADAAAVHAIVSLLPDVQRAIVLADAAARDDVACSTRLAGELGITANAVRVYRKRAMDRIRRELKAQGFRLE